MYPLQVEKAIFEVKKEYPSALVVTVVDDLDINEDVLFIVARPLSLNELNSIASAFSRDEEAGNELVISQAVRFIFSVLRDEEVDISELPVGASSKISSEVYELAGISGPEILSEEISSFRTLDSTVMYEGSRFIMTAFNQYKLSDIKNLSRTEFCELIMLAEKVHGNPFIIADKNMVTEEKTNERQLRAIHKEARTNSKLFDFGEDNEKLLEQL